MSHERDFSVVRFRDWQTFRYVQASEFARLPDRSYRCNRRAAETFTSGQNVLRYLRTHRICYPSEYRQLTEKDFHLSRFAALSAAPGAGPHLLRSFYIFSQFVEPPFYVCGTRAKLTLEI